MPNKKGRGSAKLFSSLSDTHAKALQSAISGWRVVDWHQLGKPAVEVVNAGIAGSPAKLGAVIGKLAKIKEIRELEILINGQPRPDIAQIRFAMRAKQK